MQYSTNSNQGVSLEIQTAPTLAGQYRKARLTAESHEYDLKNWELDRARIELEIRKLELKAQRLRSSGDELDELEAQQLEIDAEKHRLTIVMNDRTVADAERERNVARAEMARILGTVDYESMPEDEYQAEMGQDLIERKLRYLIAHVYGAQMGLPGEVMLELLELPIDKQAQFGARMLQLAQNNPFCLEPTDLVEGEFDGDR